MTYISTENSLYIFSNKNVAIGERRIVVLLSFMVVTNKVVTNSANILLRVLSDILYITSLADI